MPGSSRRKYEYLIAYFTIGWLYVGRDEALDQDLEYGHQRQGFNKVL